MKSLLIAKILPETVADGPGWRTSIYSTGCPHRCPGCHNEWTWPIDAGTPMTVDEVFAEILKSEHNVTFSGGDPMVQAEAFTELAKRIKAIGRNIWCYTGFTIEQCLDHPDRRGLLNNVDVLVDGRFVESLKSLDLLFRGSSNQRLIDVQETLRTGVVTEFYYDPYPKF